MNSSKVYLPISLITQAKLQEILNAVKTAICKTNPGYDVVTLTNKQALHCFNYIII